MIDTEWGDQLTFEFVAMFPINAVILGIMVISVLAQDASGTKSELAAYLAKEKQFFTENTFQVGSLVQDELVSRHLVGYENLMSTVWLEVLRSGNWKHWTKAMHDAIGVHFDIRLGVSGTVKLPTSTGQSCNASRSLKIELLSGKSLPIPAHIWAHVQAVEKTGTGQDEFVIIGHNSPFYRSDLSNLCPSMCNQVSWQRNTLFARLLEFPAFGLVQCCRVEDVAHKLDNFPGPFENANMNVSRTTEATTTPTVDLAYESFI
ncbi:GM11220 [Drosophila sechellia]|uniref:GM11220 n=1 Tax=Drosophila sechellia TaxID=7238 RepID=B4IKV5_DROSE|nr:GM11220 [Drosophila sechellia]